MTSFSDGWDEMRAEPPFDQAAAEALVAGRLPAVGSNGQDLAPLVDVISELRAWGTGPAPSPSPALMSLLDADLTCTSAGTTPVAPVLPSKRRKKMLVSNLLAGLATKLAALGLAAKAALGLGVAAAAVTTAGAAGVLPDPAQHAVATVVSAVSPFQLPDTVDPGGTGGIVEPDLNLPGSTTDVNLPDDDGLDDDDPAAGDRQVNHGACVSAVAQDRSVQGREHGAAVSAMARSDCGKTADATSVTSTTSTTSTSVPDDDTGIAEDSVNRGSGNANDGNGQNDTQGQSSGRGSGNRGSGNSGPGNSGNGG